MHFPHVLKLFPPILSGPFLTYIKSYPNPLYYPPLLVSIHHTYYLQRLSDLLIACLSTPGGKLKRAEIFVICILSVSLTTTSGCHVVDTQ